MSSISEDSEGYPIADKALAVSSVWMTGKNIGGDELNDLLMDPDDQGLYAFVSTNRPRPTDIAYNVLGAAICYVAWHAYRAQNKMAPAGIDAVTENYVQWIVDEAKKSRCYDDKKMRSFHAYLLKRFPARTSDEVGAPIDFGALKKEIS